MGKGLILHVRIGKVSHHWLFFFILLLYHLPAVVTGQEWTLLFYQWHHL